MADPTTKTCTGCGQAQLLDEYYRAATGKYGRRARCKACSAEYNAEYQAKWRAAHPEYQAEWRAEHRGEVKARRAKYRAENREAITLYQAAWYAERGDERRAYSAAWYRANPDKASAKGHRRRALEHGAYVAEVDVQAIFKRDKFRCQGCKKRVKTKAKTTDPLYPHLDHVVPLSKGGTHQPANVQLLCRQCNTRKNNGALPGGEQLAWWGG
jgi:hypothetical protein